MFLSGTLNTITAKWAQRTHSLGRDTADDLSTTIWGSLDGQDGLEKRSFDHPFFQASTMFIGEALCLVAFVIKKKYFSPPTPQAYTSLKDGSSASEGLFTNSVYFSIPAMLDMTGTGVMNAGLCLTYASVFQMLRSAVVVFTAFMSVAILKRKLRAFHWASIALVVAGVSVVGYVSIKYSGDDSTKSQSSVMLGNALVIVAQAMVALQMVVEEKIINSHGAPALKAVGFEGVFGFVILGILLVPLYYIQVSGGAHDYPIEDAVDAMIQISNSGEIQIALTGYICSIAFFNFFGISVTKAMSASHRMVLDSLRTVAVLGVSIALGWEDFHYEQLFGFALLILGTSLYNEIIRVPALFDYDDDEEVRESFVESVRQDSKDIGEKEGMAPLLDTANV
ncbi:hypothetical protein TrCOL_g12404 [Triparma columacea]|nr:hypothetical protein TrCOL_g12404 [Triparma columacea]